MLDRIVDGMRLTVVGHTTHHFPGEGGVTALYLLAESHLTIHTFPETGLATLNVYCCRVRPPLDWQRLLGEALGATSARVRELVRGEAAP